MRVVPDFSLEEDDDVDVVELDPDARVVDELPVDAREVADSVRGRAGAVPVVVPGAV